MPKNFIIVLICLTIFHYTFSKVIIIRHGQATNNTEKRYNSNPDHPNYTVANLTELGKRQVKSAAKKLKNLGINKNNVKKIIVSPLPRTQQTANILAENSVIDKNKIVINKQITEVQAGPNEGNHYFAFLHDGETIAQVEKRIRSFYKKELKNLNPTDNVLIVTHAMPATALIKEITGREPRFFDNAEFVILG